MRTEMGRRARAMIACALLFVGCFEGEDDAHGSERDLGRGVGRGRDAGAEIDRGGGPPGRGRDAGATSPGEEDAGGGGGWIEEDAGDWWSEIDAGPAGWSEEDAGPGGWSEEDAGGWSEEDAGPGGWTEEDAGPGWYPPPSCDDAGPSPSERDAGPDDWGCVGCEVDAGPEDPGGRVG
jgi:hypothetical protein